MLARNAFNFVLAKAGKPYFSWPIIHYKPKGEYHDANKIDYSQVDLAMKLIRPPVPKSVMLQMEMENPLP